MRKPDWAYWVNQADVTVSNAVVLSCDVDPRFVEGEESGYIREDELTLSVECERRFAFVHSHMNAQTLEVVRRGADRQIPYVVLAEFRAWGESLPSPLSFPEEVPKLIEKALPPAIPDDKPLGERERASLLCIIGALAKMAPLDISQPYKAASQVEATLSEEGVTLAPRTIGDHLKAVPEALHSRKG
jgi:hypothetical protein